MSILYIEFDELFIVRWVQYDTDNNTTASSSPIATAAADVINNDYQFTRYVYSIIQHK